MFAHLSTAWFPKFRWICKTPDTYCVFNAAQLCEGSLRKMGYQQQIFCGEKIDTTKTSIKSNKQQKILKYRAHTLMCLQEVQLKGKH